MSIVEQIITYLKDIKQNNTRGSRWIYIQGNVVSLVDKLPEKGFIRNDDIIVVDDISSFLKLMNKENDVDEVGKFKELNNIQMICIQESGIPTDCYDNILSYCDFNKKVKLGQVCKDFREKVEDDIDYCVMKAFKGIIW